MEFDLCVNVRCFANIIVFFYSRLLRFHLNFDLLLADQNGQMILINAKNKLRIDIG